MFWRQKAKVEWLESGDRNSSFFHAKLKEKHKTVNMLNQLENTLKEKGEYHSVLQSGRVYYESLLTSEQHEVDEDMLEVTVKQDVIRAIQEFFRGEPLPRAWKATFLALIPKTDNQCTFKDFRPISLCNVNYNKIIAKILAMRLASILPHVISEEQDGFIKGRSIYDNVALAQELVQGKKGDNLILKIDMEKAYDRFKWDFLERVPWHFGFSAWSHK